MKVAIEHDEKPQNMPRATDHVPNMLAMVESLVEKDHAYVAADGAVYFSVESFREYGKLSGNSLDQLKGGAGGRIVAENQAGKRHPADFLLWKPDATHLMKWPSKFGEGYPGWHIECSAMARAVLNRDVIDIHTGGEDNIFPHHECEIAQSVASSEDATLKRHGGFRGFAKLWMHSRHLMVEGTKMSKSKGNFFTVRQILNGDFTAPGTQSPGTQLPGNAPLRSHPSRSQPPASGGKSRGTRVVDPAVLRYEMIKANYRSQMNFTKRGLEDSAVNVRKLRTFTEALSAKGVAPAELDLTHPVVARFVDALADDLNMAGALAVVFEFVSDPPGDAAEALGVMQKFDQVLGVLPVSNGGSADGDGWAAEKITALDAARVAKDYAAADAIRDELQDAGYDVKTTKDGTVVSKRLA